MRYTVIGVWDHQGDDDTELIVAGVVAGDVPLVDTGAKVGSLAQRQLADSCWAG